MRIYKLQANMTDYQSLYAPDEVGEEALRHFDVTARGAGWVPVKVSVYRTQEQPEKLKPSDYPSLGSSAPGFSRRAVEGLWDMLEESGEILPLLCDEGDYFAYNVTRLSDALDEERSRMSRYSDGQIMH